MQKSYTAQDVRISLAEVRLWGLLIAASAYWGNVVRTGWDPDVPVPLGIVQSVTGNGAFAVGAWVVIALLALKATPGAAASARTYMATVAACLPVVFPSEQTAMLSLLGLGTQWFVSREGQDGRAIAFLLFALAGNIFWTSSYLLPLHAAVGLFDGRVVQILLHFGGDTANGYANLVTNETGKISLEILAQCASSFPLSGVCLAFVVTLLYLGTYPHHRHMVWLVTSLLGSVALTEVRLLWMASSESDYLWLHDGDGRILYSLAAALLAILFPLLAIRADRVGSYDGQLSGPHHIPGPGRTGHIRPGRTSRRQRTTRSG